VNGIRSKWQEVAKFIQEQDITVITETKLDSSATNDSLTLKGFVTNRADRNSNGGGVMSYFRATLRPSVLHESQDYAISLGLECTISRIQAHGSKTAVIVVGAYRPPNAQAGWFDSMNALIIELLPLGSIIIMGDLNADLLRPKLNPGKSFKALLSLANVKVKSVAPTRITPTSATCLDLIAIDKSITCISYGVGSLAISDHLPVTASIKFRTNQILQPVRKRSLRNVDFDEMRRRVALLQVPDETELSIDEVMSDWHTSVTTILDDMAPEKNYPWRKERCRWLTDDIRQLIDKRSYLVKNLKKQNEPHTYDELKLVKKQIKSRIRRQAKVAGDKALDDGDSKKAWQYIKTATFTHKKSSESLQNLDLLNEFFASTVTRKDTQQHSAITNDVVGMAPLFSMAKVTRGEVYKELKRVDEAAAAGPDGLSGQLIRNLASSICDSVCSMCNLSIGQGSFPSMWKRANITAIWKGKGSKDDPNNFRPISILPIIARIFERLLAAQLYRHCDLNSIIPEQQFGFRKRSSCEVALLSATDSWISQVDAGLFVGALLIDLSKAFDSVPHRKLLDELSSVGCDPEAMKWFSSYLENRFQRVTQHGNFTPWMPISQGVPQGSGLSPLLFNLYVRNLPNVCSSKVIQFADDTTASEADKDANLVTQRLASTYDNIKSFCNSKGLSLNAGKTQLIVFKTPSKKLQDDVELTVDGLSIKPQTVAKLLGFNLDHHFTWSDHIDKIVKKCNGLLGALVKASPFLNRRLLRMAYIALVRSHLDYCGGLLMSSSATQLERLDTIQRKAARMIMQVPRDTHSAPLMEKLSLESLNDRRCKHVVSLVANILGGNCHPAFDNFFQALPDGSLVPPTRSRLKIGNKRFHVIGAEVYNKSLHMI